METTAVTLRPQQFQASITITEEGLRLARQCEGLFQVAQAYEIDGPPMASAAADEVREIKSRRARLKEVRDGFIRPAKEIMDNASALFDPALNALDDAEKMLRGKLDVWNEQERKRIAEERRIQEQAAAEARRKAEEEAAALRAKAEAQAAELRRREEEVRRKAEEGDKRAAAEAAKLAQRAESVLEEAADKTAALHAQAAAVPLPEVNDQKVSGLGSRGRWVAEVTDMTAFLTAISGRTEFHTLVKIDQGALNKLAGVMKHVLEKTIPGTKVKETFGSVIR